VANWIDPIGWVLEAPGGLDLRSAVANKGASGTKDDGRRNYETYWDGRIRNTTVKFELGFCCFVCLVDGSCLVNYRLMNLSLST
jgi:hypothetical protein